LGKTGAILLILHIKITVMKKIFALIFFSSGLLQNECEGQTVIVDQSTKDTLIITSKTISITTNDIVRKPFIITPIPPVPGVSDYLKLPVGNARVISGQSNVVIENLRFESTTGVPIIRIANSSNIIIRNCFFNKGTNEAIDIENSANVLVEKNLINGVTTGIYALNSQSIKVINNQCINVRQRSGGGRGQLVQFNSVGGTGNEIINNRSEAFPGESNTEDHISLYKSSNVTVRGNMFRGGGPSTSGSGVMSGDNGGDNQLIENNLLLNTGNAGIGVAGGNNIRVLNNKIYSIRTPVSNNPLYVWAQAGAACSNITVTLNLVNWTNAAGAINKGWNAGNCGSSYNPDNNGSLTLEQLGMPVHLINFITPAELLLIRGK